MTKDITQSEMRPQACLTLKINLLKTTMLMYIDIFKRDKQDGPSISPINPETLANSELNWYSSFSSIVV